jgi:hypothetical protein
MPAPNIKSVMVSPQIVSTNQEFKISVDVEAVFYFNDLDQMSWDTVENRGLTWDNIDDSE